MPNHVTNEISAENRAAIDKLINFTSDEGEGIYFDFGKIIEKPKCLDDFNPHHGILNKAENLLGVGDTHDNELLNSMHMSSRVRSITEDLKDDLPLILQAVENYQECGHMYWYTWCIENWGTKWGAYSTSVEADRIMFDTAWSPPSMIIAELSKILPDEVIYHRWADEDTGSNVGYASYLNGTPTSFVDLTNTKAGFELAFELTGDKEYYKLVDGNYVYDEDYEN